MRGICSHVDIITNASYLLSVCTLIFSSLDNCIYCERYMFSFWQHHQCIILVISVHLEFLFPSQLHLLWRCMFSCWQHHQCIISYICSHVDNITNASHLLSEFTLSFSSSDNSSCCERSVFVLATSPNLFCSRSRRSCRRSFWSFNTSCKMRQSDKGTVTHIHSNTQTWLQTHIYKHMC